MAAVDADAHGTVFRRQRGHVNLVVGITKCAAEVFQAVRERFELDAGPSGTDGHVHDRPTLFELVVEDLAVDTTLRLEKPPYVLHFRWECPEELCAEGRLLSVQLQVQHIARVGRSQPGFAAEFPAAVLAGEIADSPGVVWQQIKLGRRLLDGAWEGFEAELEVL